MPESFSSGNARQEGDNRSGTRTTSSRSSALSFSETDDNNKPADHGNDIVLPERQYGYRTEPMTWKELKTLILKENNLARLSRSVAQEIEYQTYMRKLKCEWKSVYDHILCSKFGFEKRLVKQHDKNHDVYEAYPPLSEVKKIQKVLVLNDFPYYTDEGIFHYLLWKIGGDIITESEIEEARQDLCEKLGDIKDMIHWRNPPHLKSLPEIDHIHILCQRETKKPQSRL